MFELIIFLPNPGRSKAQHRLAVGSSRTEFHAAQRRDDIRLVYFEEVGVNLCQHSRRVIPYLAFTWCGAIFPFVILSAMLPRLKIVYAGLLLTADSWSSPGTTHELLPMT